MKEKKIKNLHNLTGQESGIVMNAKQNIIISNWTVPNYWKEHGLDKDYKPILLDTVEINEKELEELIKDKWIKYIEHRDDMIIYYSYISNKGATLYKLSGDITVICPKNWLYWAEKKLNKRKKWKN